MGFDDKILGELTKKFGIGGDQAKAALEKMVPFLKGKLGALGGGGNVGLLSQIKSTDLTPDDLDNDEKESHVQDVAKASGLPADTVKQMLPDVMAFLKR
jgi:hypothetical protein